MRIGRLTLGRSAHGVWAEFGKLVEVGVGTVTETEFLLDLRDPDAVPVELPRSPRGVRFERLNLAPWGWSLSWRSRHLYVGKPL
jgi:hypothetical protein